MNIHFPFVFGFSQALFCAAHIVKYCVRVAQNVYVMILLQSSDTFPENKWLPGLKIIEHHVRCKGYSARTR
jgi:hypothetical protein